MSDRLAPGVEVVVLPARGGENPELALRTANGEFLRVRTGGVPADELVERLRGASRTDGEAEAAQLVEAFREAGYLQEAAERQEWPEERRDVWLLGERELTGPLARCLEAAGARPRTAEPEELAYGRPAAVVWCRNSPVPHGLWDVADTLPARGAAWLRCHREGWQLWLEPLSADPGDTTSAQLRARRLAATPAHRELSAYWNELRVTGHPVPLTPAAAHVAAGLLAADLTAWATGTSSAGHGLPAGRRLRCLDLRDLSLSEHPVLPVPPVTARDGAG